MENKLEEQSKSAGTKRNTMPICLGGMKNVKDCPSMFAIVVSVAIRESSPRSLKYKKNNA